MDNTKRTLEKEDLYIRFQRVDILESDILGLILQISTEYPWDDYDPCTKSYRIIDFLTAFISNFNDYLNNFYIVTSFGEEYQQLQDIGIFFSCFQFDNWEPSRKDFEKIFMDFILEKKPFKLKE